MAYCRKCGNPIDDNAIFCSHCGADQGTGQPGYTDPAPQAADNGGFGWGLLGFCVPIVGLILFLVWKDTKPRTSAAAGKGALVSVILSVVFYILAFALGMFGYLVY